VADNDDLLSADEIEALIQAAQSNTGASPPAGAALPAYSGGDMLDPSEIESLMQGNGPAANRPAPPRARTPSAAESILQQAESQLAAALSNQGPRGIPAELGTPAPFSYQDLGSGGSPPADPFPLSTLQDVELDLRIELGRTELLIDEVLKLRAGSVVPLDKLAGDPVDILVNGRLIARGEVLVLNDNFCVRVAEILTPDG
jgi:flagellar motor switch protein FliN/FliY